MKYKLVTACLKQYYTLETNPHNMSKQYVQPDELRVDSFTLGAKIMESEFRPDFMIALWRGGAPIGCYVHEFLKYFDLNVDHIAIRTSKYTGIDQASSTVKVHNLGYVSEKLRKETKLLLVDDIFDTGLSIDAVIRDLTERLGDNMPLDVKVATIFYKPSRNKTTRVPDYYIHDTNRWVVFPHELEAMTLEDIEIAMGSKISEIIKNTKKND